MKTAICTHCGEKIERVGDQWKHEETGKLTCTVIEFATPRRGTIKTEGAK